MSGPSSAASWEAVIGLEVHVQLQTATKMFCGCENRFGAEPNSLTCPVCLGHPGSLTVANRRAVEYAVRVGLACGCDIAHFTKFDRKNYFYPDQPKNYQISQYDLPIAARGTVEIVVGAVRGEGGRHRSVRLRRIHLEEDAGKNLHVDGEPISWVDLNRAGVPLIEIVSEPDLHTPEEAGAYLRTLRQIILYLGVSDCNMEEGSLRCDCNISVRPAGGETLGTRAEIKNLNSFANVERALAYEIKRQVRVLESGGDVVQETRLFDPGRDETRSMREKEEAHDYRYFPDPDLAPIRLDQATIDLIRGELPELPLARFRRLSESFGISPYHADVLTRERSVADFFEEAAAVSSHHREVAVWIVNAIREEMNERRSGIGEIGLSPARLAELVDAIEDGKVSKQKARDVFRAMLGSERSVGDIIGDLGLEQISDDSLLGGVIDRILAAHPGAIDDVRDGKKNSINFLVGQVMRETKGQANPGLVARMIAERIRR